METSWKVAIVAFSVTCEVVKQCTSFATRYYADDGQYPVPQTALVLAVELIKLVSVSVILLKTGTVHEVQIKKHACVMNESTSLGADAYKCSECLNRHTCHSCKEAKIGESRCITLQLDKFHLNYHL